MNRRSLTVGTILILLLGGVVWALTRNSPVEDPAQAPTPTQTVTASPTTPPPSTAPTTAPTVAADHTTEWLTLADKYVAAYQAGKTSGGEEWLARLRPIASPGLVKAVAATDPERIGDSDPLRFTAGADTVRVGFRDGTWLRLHIAANPAGGWWVTAVEGSRSL